MLSASDIDTYRTCPLKYKFARVFRIPQEPTIHQRFGILVHQVLERFHGRFRGRAERLPELLGLLDAGWRRAGFGDSEEERQLRGKAAAALDRYWDRFQSEDAEPVWFERAFTFRLGPHLLRGRVDRVDRLPGGEYELIDYKTGRPKSAAQLTDDVQLSLYAVGRPRGVEPRGVPSRPTTTCSMTRRWRSRTTAAIARSGSARSRSRSPTGILSQGFEPTPSLRGVLGLRLPADVPGGGAVTVHPSGEQFEIRHGEQRAAIVEVGGGIREYHAGDRRGARSLPARGDVRRRLTARR